MYRLMPNLHQQILRLCTNCYFTYKLKGSRSLTDSGPMSWSLHPPPPSTPPVWILSSSWWLPAQISRVPIGQFSEAGLLEWMRFVIFCARSCERLQRTSGRFLSRCCFMLCVTVEVEPRIAKQYKWQYCCSCINHGGKGMKGGKKVSLHHLLAGQKITSLYKKSIWGIL